MALLNFVRLVIVSTLFISNIAHDKRIHQCVHDKITENQELREINVNYDDHPYDKTMKNMGSQRNSRRLLSPSTTSPIRISAYYDPTTISTAYLSQTNIDYIKSLVSSTIRYYQRFLSVVPVSGRFYVPRVCFDSYYTAFEGVTNCALYVLPYVCGIVTIPDDHYGENYLYHYYYYGNTTASKLPAGQGILNTDLLIYVSYNGAGCGGSTLAWARSCMLDQYGRPVVGTVNICPYMFSGANYWKMDMSTMVHEVGHVIVMSPGLWSNFRDSNGDLIPFANVVDETNPMNDNLLYIISPTVKQLAIKHFNCSTLDGLPLENSGGSGSNFSHWDEKYLQSAVMSSTSYSALTYFTEFTFALMDDSGWYVVDYNYSEPFYWGKNAGCQLWNDKCVDSNTHESNFNQYYCDAGLDYGCTYEYAAPASCLLLIYPSPLPTPFQYFTDPKYGGPESADYCPFRDPPLTNNDYESACWDTRGNTFSLPDTYGAQNYALNSRCVGITDTSNIPNKNGFCFQHQCFGYDSVNKQWDGVLIKISATENITCNRTEQPGYKTVTTKTASSITADVHCPDIDAICGQSSQPFTCYWGHYNDELAQCICSAGYTGSDCSTQDTTVAFEAQTISKQPTVSPTIPISTTLCVENFSPNVNGEYTFDGIWNFYPKWRLGQDNLYVFWNIIYHYWLIYSQTDSMTYWVRCNVSVWTPDISACNGYWYSNGYGIEPNAKTYMGLCGSPVTHNPTKPPTDSPSKNPTQSPSKSPTNNPTHSPSLNPTKNPTVSGFTYPPSVTPSKAPTNNPSTSPTKAPTKNPSATPSNSPSKTPSTNPSTTPTQNPSMSPTSITTQPTNAPSNMPSTNPSINPSIPPTKPPSNMPTQITTQPTNAPSNIPTVSPTNFRFRRQFSIALEYINTTECNVALFINEIKTFTMKDVANMKFDIDNVLVLNDMNNSLIDIDYQISTNVSDNMLGGIETAINSARFRQLLTDDLEETFDCIDFKFIGFDMTTSTVATSQDENTKKPKDKIELLDWQNYNNTELLIVGGIGIVGLIVICLMFYCIIKCCCCNDRDDTKNLKHSNNAASVVEFGGFQAQQKQKKVVFSNQFLEANNRNMNSVRRESAGSHWLEI